jgi:alkanesulfonate monooxygenase SsuD/methylene tetrahydromethanopterin reductase-like flavin-dependent oxidoreductase (luciferase family)
MFPEFHSHYRIGSAGCGHHPAERSRSARRGREQDRCLDDGGLLQTGDEDGTMKLGYGLITCQRYPGDGRTDADLYREAIELAVEAERLGLDSVWVSEHHFVDDAYMPSLLPMAAAIAARTERVEIGTGLLLSPLHDPLRVAEDAATVDLISDGRLILGVGLGWRREEFEGFGIPLSQRRQRLVDAIHVMRESWSDGLVHGTESHPVPGISVTPKPPRPGGPPVWIGAFAERAVRRAGRIADGYMAGDAPPEEFAQQVAWARAELERRPQDEAARFALSIYQPTFAWHGDDAWQLVRDHHHYVSWKYEDMDGAFGRTGPPPPPPALTPEAEQELRSGMVLGAPEAVAEGISRYRDVAGDDLHYVARLYWPGQSFEIQRDALRVFAEEVAPLLR